MVEIHLYGSLRRLAPDPRADRESVARLDPRPEETVGTALARIGVPQADVCHVFLNGALLSTRNSMAPWLKYQPVGERARGWETPLRPGDRLGVFARDMALLVV